MRLVSVPVGLEWAFNWKVEVVGLCLCELGQLDVQALKVGIGDLSVESQWQSVARTVLVLAVGVVLPELDLSKRLVGEGGRHDEGWVTSGTAEVDQSAFGKENDVLSCWEQVSLHLWLDSDD